MPVPWNNMNSGLNQRFEKLLTNLDNCLPAWALEKFFAGQKMMNYDVPFNLSDREKRMTRRFICQRMNTGQIFNAIG